jgi:ceramide glucosyltransferase
MAVRRVGLQVAIPPIIVTHVCAEQSLRELLLHEIRWARTIRAMDSLGFAGLAVTYAVPLALLGVILGGLTPAASVLVVALACRFALQAELHRLLQLRNGIFWLGPIRDILSFVVFVASFLGRRVEWRGQRYGVKADHTLVYYSEAD